MPDVQRIDLLDPAEVARFGGIEIVAQGVVEGFLSGIHRSPFRGFSVEFTEHRAYQPGDELRYLDWRILARADRLFVKQFEEETNLRAMILVDVSRSMAWRGAPARLTKRAYADRLVAADRKSTRLNSSHVEISYAVFCLKKKKKKKEKIYNER